MSEGYDRVTISARVPEPLRDRLDEWVEASEHGNRGAAIEAIIESQLGDETVTLDQTTDEYRPAQPHLDAVYQAALTASGADHQLVDEQLSSLATAVNNDPDAGINPDGAAIKRYLRDLEAENYVSRDFGGGNARGDSGRLVWHIKPLKAIPEEWSKSREQREYYREKVNDLRQLREVVQPGISPERLRNKFERYLGEAPEDDAELYRIANVAPPEETEDGKPIDTTTWLAEERVAADGGESA